VNSNTVGVVSFVSVLASLVVNYILAVTLWPSHVVYGDYEFMGGTLKLPANIPDSFFMAVITSVITVIGLLLLFWGGASAKIIIASTAAILASEVLFLIVTPIVYAQMIADLLFFIVAFAKACGG